MAAWSSAKKVQVVCHEPGFTWLHGEAALPANDKPKMEEMASISAKLGFADGTQSIPLEMTINRMLLNHGGGTWGVEDP
jgi:hypothetical protein